jgi:hypothetical protein
VINLSVADVLDGAADLLEKPGAWTQGVLARHANGNPIDPSEPNASCWCALGAITRIDDGPKIRAASDAVGRLTTHGITYFNDMPGRTQAEVIAKLREAAALSRAGGADRCN